MESPTLPATRHAAQAVWAQAAPPDHGAATTEGSRSHAVPSSTLGASRHAGSACSAAPRQPQAQRTVAKPGRKQSAHEGNLLGQRFGTLFGL